MSLGPLDSLFARLLEARARRYATGRAVSHRFELPVVSVGNLTMGGTGKTPMVELLSRRFLRDGRRPAILSRGYGRSSRGVVVVSRGEGRVVGAAEGGDEPVALARRLPGVIVVVARRRIDAARAAQNLGADLLILDDGYQHLALQRDVNLLLLDAGDPFGGGRFPPGGLLREPLSALSRADAFVFTRAAPGLPSAAALRTVAQWNPAARVFTARLAPEGLVDETGSALEPSSAAAKGLVSVCGIARPDSFSAALEAVGVAARERIVFGDHHRYRDRDLARIRRAARGAQSGLVVTTEKDAVKLEGRLGLPLAVLRIGVEIAEPDFFPFLASRLPARPRAQAALLPR